MRLSLLAAGTLLSASSLVAQVNVGFTFNVSVGATSRGAAAERACQLLARFDAEDYRGYGVEPGTSTTNPTWRDLAAYTFILQDQYALAGGQEQYDFRLYAEGATPELPNFLASDPVGTNEIVHFGPFTSPVGGTTADPRGAWFVTIGFGAPVAVPPLLDIFPSVELQASQALNTAAVPPYWPNDGLSVQIALGVQPGANFTVFDIKGPGLISGGNTANSYGLVHDVPNSSLAYGGARQVFADFQTTSSLQGQCVATTSQASYTISNLAPGTASFYSGLHPDPAGIQNGGRTDDLGFRVVGAQPGELLMYGVDFSFDNLNLPLSVFYPGPVGFPTTGMACLPLTLQIVSLGLAGGTGVDFFQLSLNATSRPFAVGLNLAWQAYTFNAGTGALRGSPCGMQRF
ncbi:MAG: hypothetical protein IPK26_29485 [Planctomycetes bacterium]|nr:hypothetical protein [Planctomycetota bacterium]